MKRLTFKGFTAIETVLAVAILSGVGLTMSQVFTRAHRMAENSRQGERAFALGQMVLEQYNAYARRGHAELPSYDCTRATPREFFHTGDDWGYSNLQITTRAEPHPDESETQVTVRVSWGAGLSSQSVSLVKIYPHWMSGASGG